MPCFNHYVHQTGTLSNILNKLFKKQDKKQKVNSNLKDKVLINLPC